MPTAREFDDHLASMQDELRVVVKALNELHHPVYPSSPERIAALEARVEELRAAIRDRRAQLKAAASADASHPTADA